MTYTQLAVTAILVAVVVDLKVLRTRILTTKVFWACYAIIVFFQLLSNGIFTGAEIVKYRDFAIVGSDSPSVGSPPFIGDGRLAFAPIEDLGFGFGLVVLSLSLWRWFEKRGVDSTTTAGPPRVWIFSGRLRKEK